MAMKRSEEFARKAAALRAAGQPVLLTGGNPQIPKGEGEGPVRDWIAAAPGWKSAGAARLDALVEAAVPGVRRAVKWNTPLYGVEPGTWFLGLNCITPALKVTFFRGAALDPLPPVGSRQPTVRYWHWAEGEPLDEARFLGWVRQAAALPGERM